MLHLLLQPHHQSPVLICYIIITIYKPIYIFYITEFIYSQSTMEELKIKSEAGTAANEEGL
jgi:hypothetical protein